MSALRDLQVADGLAAGKSYAEVGAMLGVSRQRAQQIAKGAGMKSLLPVGSPPTGIREKREVERPGGKLGLLWDQAVERGLSVRQRLNEGHKPDAMRLVIREKLCRLHVPRSKFVPKGLRASGYYRLRGPARGSDFHVVLAEGSWLVIPELVLEAGKRYYVPAKPVAPYNNHTAKVKWEEYWEAWWRLR